MGAVRLILAAPLGAGRDLRRTPEARRLGCGSHEQSLIVGEYRFVLLVLNGNGHRDHATIVLLTALPDFGDRGRS